MTDDISDDKRPSIRGPGLTPAIAFFIHKRPDSTRRVFREIAKAKPHRLFIIADGPDERNAREAKLCACARDIVEAVTWKCDVLRDYADTKLGLKKRISSGLDRVFSLSEEAIILEDDCVPHPDFFRFCETLLRRFQNDERVMMISGNNFQEGVRRGAGSYYFSRIAHIWGWATWRRAWRRYDINMKSFPSFAEQRKLDSILPDNAMREHYLDLLRSTFNNQIDNWGYRWQFAVWDRDGLVAVPKVNLVTNIGFGPGATHTPTPHPLFSNRPAYPLGPIEHPVEIFPDDAADLREFLAERAWYHRPLARRVWDRLMRTIYPAKHG